MQEFPNSLRRSGVAWHSFATASVCALLAVPAFGLNPNHQLSQYAHTAWRVQDGVFSGAPNAMAQTSDGYLWIGTEAGLVRFDGVNFAPFRPSPKERLRSPSIKSLMAASDGSLWIGTASYLAHFKDGDLTSYLDQTGMISSIHGAKDGNVWIGRIKTGDSNKGPLCKVVGSKLRCYGTSDGVPLQWASKIVEGEAGSWWIADANRLAHWKGDSSTLYAPRGLVANQGLDGFTSLAIAVDGSLWAGIQQPGSGLGLQHFAGGKWRPLKRAGFDSSRIAVSAMFFDRDHSLWVGTTNAGIYRINGSTVDRFQASDGLSSDSVRGFFEDREGNVWVATTKGVDKFRELRVVTYSKSEGLSADQVDSALAASDGTIWVGNGVLDSIRGAKISSINLRNGLPGREITSLLEDRAGRMWVGVDNKLFILKERKFTEIKKADGQPVGIVEHIVENPDGTIWVRPSGVPQKLIHIRDYKVVEEVAVHAKKRTYALAPDPAGGVWMCLSDGDMALYSGGRWKVIPLHRKANTGKIEQFVSAKDGGILGVSSLGLLELKGGKTQTLTTENDLPCNWIYSLVFDSKSTLWLYSRCGLMAISDSELQRWWQYPDAKIKVRTFDILDGAQPAPPSFKPSASMSPDGKLWFANGNVLQQLDPLHLSVNTVIPAVHIEEIIADKKEYSTQKRVPLPALTRELQINYTALSFVIPQRVRFRYKLEGWENEWQDAGTRRQAFYTNLRPATYRFHVIACNDDGVWNDAGDSLSFTIAPAYYQTRWFEFLCVAVIAGVLWVLYLLRLKQATLQVQERLGARMEERERIARELHDTLLQGFHGLMLRFQAVMKVLPAEGPAREMMGRVLDRADEVLLEGRESVRDLRESGMVAGELSEMLATAGAELSQGTTIVFSFVLVGDPKALDPVAFKETYRIAREALSNAFQHSQGTKIELELTYNNSGCSVRVRDDGTGIDSVILRAGKTGHWGLSGMRERAQELGAQLNIWSKPGAGTEVELTVPAAVAYPQRQKEPMWWRIRRSMKRSEGTRG